MSDVKVQSGKHMLVPSSSQFDPPRPDAGDQPAPRANLTRKAKAQAGSVNRCAVRIGRASTEGVLASAPSSGVVSSM